MSNLSIFQFIVILCLSIFASTIWAGDDDHILPDRLTVNQFKKFTLRTIDGKTTVSDLKYAMGVEDTTSCRQEQKSVLPSEIWTQILEKLQNYQDDQHDIHGIVFKNRDEVAKDGGINLTFTFYGKGAKFENHGVSTKVRMRARFYLVAIPEIRNAAGEIVRAFKVIRSPITNHKGFLEIKIKNPSPQEENSVNKYRLVIADEDMIALFHANSRDASFPQIIEDLKAKAKSITFEGKKGAIAKNDPKLVDEFFAQLSKLATKDPAFLSPQFAISYERSGLSLEEQDYPVPIRKEVKKSFHWPFSKKKFKEEISKKRIEYQMTIDKNVNLHTPIIPSELPIALSDPKEDWIAKHLYPESGTFNARYPANAMVLEFKDPAPVAYFPSRKRSATHNVLYQEIIAKMKSDIMANFEVTRGKAGHFSKYYKHQTRSSVQPIQSVQEVQAVQEVQTKD